MNEIILAGCNPIPLASYLKALGILRLVAEQADPAVRGYWRAERFVLVSRLTQAELLEFFLQDYRPTPILSPWNGRAGYLEGDDAEESKRTGAALLTNFRRSNAVGFAPYRELIATLDTLPCLDERNRVRTEKKVLEAQKKAAPKSWNSELEQRLSKVSRREGELKEGLLELLRNELPEEKLDWLDAVVAINGERAFSPLLGGSGGVEGSMDLGVNFMINLLAVLNLDDGDPVPLDSSTLLDNALSANPACLTVKNTAGSLAPNRVGGVNATSGFEKSLNINPWDFILMIEGAITFRPTLTKRLDSSGDAQISYPFTVQPSSIGSGAVSHVDDAKTRSGRSELWLPLWELPAGYSELMAVLREGSARVGARIAQDGLDMVRAIAQLGVDRGLAQFQRYIFLKRLGENALAVPLNRIAAPVAKNSHVDLADDIDRRGFLRAIRSYARGKYTPARSKQAVAALENALFTLTRPGAGSTAVQHALVALGELLQILAASRKGQAAVATLPRLSPAWVLQAHDGSRAYRIAVALASLPEMVRYLAPVARQSGRGDWVWHPESRSRVWSGAELTANLNRIAIRRVLDFERAQATGSPLPTNEQAHPFRSGLPTLAAPVGDIAGFLSARADDRRIAALLQGLIWCRLPDGLPATSAPAGPPGLDLAAQHAHPLPVAYRLLKPLFTPAATLRRIERLPADVTWGLPQGLLPALASGQRSQLTRGVQTAWQRSRLAGLGWPVGICPAAVDQDSRRLLAALIIPLRGSDLRRLVPRPARLNPPTAPAAA